MSRLEPEKLSVEFREGVTKREPIMPRRYTLTHSDITAELFLTIGSTYAFDQINPMRDEVLGEWILNGENYIYMAYVYVDGGGPYNPATATIRNQVFRRELPLALEAIRYGDRQFFNVHPKLDNAPLIISFMSSDPQFNKRENWGTFSDYTIRISSSKKTDCISLAEVELKTEMRSLWEEHVAWTRMTIISLTFDLPDVDEVITRLLQNAEDMGDALRPLYGDQIGDRFAELIKEHLLIAADLVNAAIAGDAEAATEAERKWYANADEISLFMSKINPYLSEEEFRNMFYTHLDLTKSEAVAMINMEYEKDIQIYDEIEEQALGMSDAITDAIVKQFPQTFRM
ncbi:hypothetical protein CEY16_11465 [Halalkalibacillus sediminis]|uniref:Staygreen protein domain-containing protein n=1 Tax=Halalkalibacillus sediminis TaxID=2018042 RepID=A0A2I0QSR2_9BACI|nr:staygreen family protein [Halalkalibacillus sediminis]PKR77344.1 hypothetical protein CEY16_11465 [Halalkalibacillus sediminis]